MFINFTSLGPEAALALAVQGEIDAGASDASGVGWGLRLLVKDMIRECSFKVFS